MPSQLVIISASSSLSFPPQLEILHQQLQYRQEDDKHIFSATLDDDLSTMVAPLLEDWRTQAECDICLVNSQILPDISKPGVLLMDMDSTVIDMECIDELAKLAGVGEQVAAVTERAMQGELDFEQSLRSRVAALKGADGAIIDQVAQSLPLNPGVKALVDFLRSKGWITAIASGGFTVFAEKLQQQLGLDFVIANNLVLTDGVLTGELTGRIIDAQAKADTLLALCERQGVAPTQSVAMGDGANDLVMMKAAGLGVAYRAKPVVAAQADMQINVFGLDNLMYLLDSTK